MGEDGRSSVLDIPSLRRRLETQLEMVSKQSDMQVWSLGERSRSKMLTQELVACR